MLALLRNQGVSIVSALELPVSVMMAYVLLNEENATQWIGIVLIITAIVIKWILISKKTRSKAGLDKAAQ
jgi:drug/metabolite transporter (DMT)-like permease